jgi:serine/threonine-protein kinase
VLERLAEGGMGSVYRAEHIALHKEVAIKLVQDGANSDHALRFLREAMLTSRIDHKNVISTIDYGTLEGGMAYLVMSLVEGPTLGRVMWTERPMWWVRAAEIAAQIVDAVAAAHAQGIVHRDLKPENVVLQPMPDGTDVVKVLDFGLAKYIRDSLAPPPVRGVQHVTRMGVVLGTPGYMAPEQAVGMRADHRADLYAIGVMLWECVAGRRLWDRDDLQQILTTQLGNRPPLLREETGDPTIPEAFEALVAELLATRPEKRPQSAVEARDRLRALVDAGRSASRPGVELPPHAEPRPIAVTPPAPTSTIFIADALARWRAAAGQTDPQPTTQVGFRAAAPVAQDDLASDAGPCSLPPERAVAGEANAPALPPPGEVAQRVASSSRTSLRLYVAVPVALALLASVLWAMPAPASPRALAPAPARAHGAPKAERNVTGAAGPAPAAAAPPLASDVAMSAPIGARAASPVQPLAAGTTSQTARAGTSSGRERASVLRAQARAHWRRAEFALAAQRYRLAIQAAPGYAGAHAGLGACQLALGDARGAIASYTRAIRRSPATSGFHAALGRAYVMAGDRARAVAEYRKAVALDPANATASSALARLMSPASM